MIELKKHNLEYIAYHDMRDHVAKKYDINERDYAGKFSKVKSEDDRLRDYLLATGVKNIENFFNKGDVALSDLTEEEKQVYLDWFRQPPVPYQDFWHWQLENMFSGFTKGRPLEINWQEAKEEAKENNAPDWVQEILEMYYTEFGDETYTVIIDW